MIKDVQINAIQEAQLLGIFKKICEKYCNAKYKIRNLLAYSPNKEMTVSALVRRETGTVLEKDETTRMLELITAFINKSMYRKKIPDDVRKKLLVIQENKCAICGSCISECSHLDHIVPFKYVGDELKNNYQLLCATCNEKKNKSLEYQIKVLFNLV